MVDDDEMPEPSASTLLARIERDLGKASHFIMRGSRGTAREMLAQAQGGCRDLRRLVSEPEPEPESPDE